ncbi:MAG: toxin-antitoxin system YwqK family antitoxin [Elusimicrobiaceae bacterium]|nr:toxin-antitoxin system YwqK family antitoxin [Elusimicrobiaceae bacterium]
MSEKSICIVTPDCRTYYHAVSVAKEFLDKDQNIIHATGTIPDGEVEEIKTSTKTIKHYKNGKLDGELAMIDLTNGEVTFTEQYKDGMLTDVADHSSHSAPIPAMPPLSVPSYKGTIVKISKGTLSYYANGKEVAEQTVAPNGSVLEQLGEIPDGPVREFDENGTVRFEATYENNKPKGEIVRYDEKGNIISRENYQHGHLNGPAHYYTYSQNGMTSVEANYKNALLDGVWNSFHINGKPHISATYQNGKLQGEYTVMYKDGKLNVKENYENGKLHGTREIYFPDGQLWYQENYKNGRLDGERFCFFPNGNKFLEEYYAEGLLEGTRKIFAQNGQLLTNEEYHWGTLVHNTERKPL